LEIYQLSKELVKDIYKLSSSFPSDEKYALVQQINRAAVSVASNIASIKKSNISTIFQPHLQLYLNSVLYNINI
jgi:four helix bundle protein